MQLYSHAVPCSQTSCQLYSHAIPCSHAGLCVQAVNYTHMQFRAARSLCTSCQLYSHAVPCSQTSCQLYSHAIPCSQVSVYKLSTILTCSSVQPGLCVQAVNYTHMQFLAARSLCTSFLEAKYSIPMATSWHTLTNMSYCKPYIEDVHVM